MTIDNVNISKKIYGTNIGALKVKTTQNMPTPVNNDLVEIPPKIIERTHELIQFMDVMYVKNMPMLTRIDRSLIYRTLVTLTSRVTKELYQAIDVVFRHYNKAVFVITYINCDDEFKTLIDEVNDKLNITMNYNLKGEHVPEAELNNRTIGDCIRATYHNLTCKIIPRIMLKYFTMMCTEKLHLFPAKC